MTRITICRPDDSASLPTERAPRSVPSLFVLLAGIGVGVTVGFLVGELAGPAAERTVKRGRVTRKARLAVSELVLQAQAALDGDVLLRDCALRVLLVGPGRLELHGWVGDRRSRARAAHLVGDAVRAEALINCLLVRGEDDTLPEAIDLVDDELLA